MLRPILLLSLSAILPLSACDSGPASKSAPTSSASESGAPVTKPAEKPAPKPAEVVLEKPAEVPATKVATPPSAPQATEPVATTKPVDAPPADPAIARMREFIATQAIDKNAAQWKTKLPLPPKLSFDASTKYFWQLTTSEGPIRIRLQPETAPMHVSSTIYLTELGFYDGLAFHRVITGFMAQGGCPLGTGTGSPGYKYAGEFAPDVKHDRPGLLSMANAGPGTDGSQFFLTFVPTPHLDGRHTIFGEVVEGQDVLKKLESFGSRQGPTSKPLSIQTAKIVVE